MSTPPDGFQIPDSVDNGEGLIDTLTIAELSALLAEAHTRESQDKLAQSLSSNLA
jgi:hypothetical protein